MNAEELKKRTKAFALRVLDVVDALPRTVRGRTLGGQLADSGTSVAANYRAACRARSKAEFISKLGIVIEEADETGFWLEMILDSKLLTAQQLAPLIDEADQFVAIMTSSRKTAQASLNRQSAIGNRQ